MIYLYAFLLTAIYLLNSQVALPNILVLGTTAVLYFFAYYEVKKKHSSMIATVAMMIISLPFSWNPIWGGNVGDSILTWYYAWTMVAIFKMFANLKNKLPRRYIGFIIVCILLILYSIIPLILSHSITEGLKELIMISFFVLIILGVMLSGIRCNEEQKKELDNLYIFTAFLIGAGMLLQYLAFRMFGVAIFGFKQLYSYGGEIQTGCHLLMDDASSGTILLGVAAMLAFVNRKVNRFYFMELVVIIVGMACSGRRTGALTLVLVMGVYYVFGVKRLQDKIKSVVGFGILATALLYFMSASRAITNAQQMFDDNGRFKLWNESVQLFIEKPILGYGFDNVYLEKIMPSQMIVHNSLLRWLNMGGVFFGGLMIALFLYFLFELKKSNLKDYLWSVLYACAAAMLIPDILNARFFYAIALMAMMCVNARIDRTSKIND